MCQLSGHLGCLYRGWWEGGISHLRLCAGAGERSRGPGEDSLQYFSCVLEEKKEKEKDAAKAF
jgi:hypothetical protein